MGLSERKNKQKIAPDPRNLGWSQDTNRFSYQHLAKFGWDPTQGLGSENNQGNREHIKVVRKLDSSGIGVARAMKEGAEIGGAGEGLNSLFARLKKAGSAHVEGAEGETVVVSPGPMVFDTVSTSDETDADANANAPVIIAPEPRPLGNSSRSKYVRSKRLAASSPAAMAEILGIPISSLPAPPSPLSQPPTPGPSSLKQSNSRSSTSEAEDVLDDHKITVAKISVGEYFRRRLAQKKAEREGGPVPEFDDTKPEVYNEVAKGFEGKKIVFGGDEDEEDVKVKMEVEEEEEEAKQAERGVGGAGLGSAGDLNAVRSEATSPVPEVKAKKEKKDKKEKREKKDKEKKKDKGKQRANVEEGEADVPVKLEEGVEQARVKLEPVGEADKKEKKKSDKKEKKEKREKSGEKGEGKKRKRDDDDNDDETSELKKEKKAKKEKKSKKSKD
ncbi:hypothetical protein HD553DRAFT_318433 [Filobasidium floriforme]|uniref:uncharacterized protein n=1 Tax=Filobasidium floriforme TaxID=5210 RepID=UPI001E8E4D82|nr:uncharacterized protein HD553DRAFT_318433 [Filobasidium floriforme]KAH8079726.1 hypothetical protein HD553DRAFT_318433 [Filobasidium floriforme]